MSEFEPRQRSRRADRHQQSKPTLEQAFSQAKPLVNPLREQAAPLVDSLAQPAVLAMAAVPLLLHFLRIFFGFIYFFPWLFELLCLPLLLLPAALPVSGERGEGKMDGLSALAPGGMDSLHISADDLFLRFPHLFLWHTAEQPADPPGEIALCLTLALWLFKGRDSLLKPSSSWRVPWPFSISCPLLSPAAITRVGCLSPWF